MPQQESRTRKPSAKQAVINKVKKSIKQNVKPRKKNHTKTRVDGSTTDESPSDEEPQPRKRKKTSLEETEEISIASDSSGEEPELIHVMDTSDGDQSHALDGADDDADVAENSVSL